MVSVKTVAVIGLTGAALVTVLLFRKQIVQAAFNIGNLGGEVITAPFLGLASAFTDFSKTIDAALNPPGPALNQNGTTAKDVNAAIQQANLPAAPPAAVPYIAAAATLPPATLDQAVNLLLGNTQNVNLAGNNNLIAAENSLTSQLSQQAANQLLTGGQTAIGEYVVPGGRVQPLTASGLAYYQSIGYNPKQVIAY